MGVELVQGCVPIEVQIVVVVYLRSVFDVVPYLSDVQHCFEIQVKFQCGHRRRKFSFLNGFCGFGRWADWLT